MNVGVAWPIEDTVTGWIVRTGRVFHSLSRECTAPLRLTQECIDRAQRRGLLAKARLPLRHVQALLLRG